MQTSAAWVADFRRPSICLVSLMSVQRGAVLHIRSGTPHVLGGGGGPSSGHVASSDPSWDVTQRPSRGTLIDWYSCKDPLGVKGSPCRVSLSWRKKSPGAGCGGATFRKGADAEAWVTFMAFKIYMPS